MPMTFTFCVILSFVLCMYLLADQITVLWSVGKLKLWSIGKVVQRARKMSEFLLGDIALTSQESFCVGDLQFSAHPC